MSEQEAVQLMGSTKSLAEWRENVARVKAAHGGKYPDWWYQAIVLSGLATRVSLGWET